MSDWVKIKRGARQGCVLSPSLFNVYSEFVLRHLQEHPGVIVGGRNVNNVRYADVLFRWHKMKRICSDCWMSS